MRRLLFAAMTLLGLGCGSTVACVARGARVRVPRGTRAIEEIAVGDEVLCVDPATGAHHVTRVTHVKSAHRECVRLELGAGTLTLTSDHPVYCPDDGAWAPAGDWALGKRKTLALCDGHSLKPVAVTARHVHVGIHQVFDLTVEHELHNFVANDVLVHNKPQACRTGDSCASECQGDAGTITCPSGSTSCECTTTCHCR